MLLILPLKLLDRVWNKIRLKHYSIRTIQELPSTCIYQYGHINYLINRRDAPVPSAGATGHRVTASSTGKVRKEVIFYLLSADPEGIGSAFHRAGRAESKNNPSLQEKHNLM